MSDELLDFIESKQVCRRCKLSFYISGINQDAKPVLLILSPRSFMVFANTESLFQAQILFFHPFSVIESTFSGAW